MADETPEQAQDPTARVRENIRQVRTSVMRNLLEELRQEIELMDSLAYHGKADRHTKQDLYVKSRAAQF
jgi:hypothetical protein